MAGKDNGAKERILAAATELVKETENIDSVTVRQIAERAEVGIGTINYHFESRENLLSLAIAGILADIVADFTERSKVKAEDPVSALKELLRELTRVCIENEMLVRFLLARDTVKGDFSAALYLIPLLRDVFGNGCDEMKLRVLALQILQPIRSAGLAPDAFRLYCGTDLRDKESRDRFTDSLIENLILKG